MSALNPDLPPVDDEQEWRILDSLDICREAGMIQTALNDDGHDLSEGELIDRLEYLVANHVLHLINGVGFDRDGILAQHKGGPKVYWFGRTETGFLRWLRRAEDWQKATCGVKLSTD